MHSIYFYSGSKKNNLNGGAIRNPKQILVYTFIVASEEMHSIDFYSGSKKKTLGGGGVQFEILKKNQV